MAANFPEIWLGRVIQNLDKSDIATFLNGIAEIAASVVQINAGTLTEMNKIYVPSTEFDVDVLINNTTYPIAIQTYADGTIEITLDKYQTKVISLPEDQTLGASYDIIDVATKNLIRSIVVRKYKQAIHSIAPAADSADTPVILATGGADALEDPTGRKRLTYVDIVALKQACDDAGMEEDNRRLVLNTNHWNDLLLDRKNFGNQLVDYVKGKPSPVISDFELHKYPVMPIYTAAKAKRPYGSVADPTDLVASVVFVKEKIGKKTGVTRQYYDKPSTTMQANQYALRHYFVAVPYQNKHIGAIL